MKVVLIHHAQVDMKWEQKYTSEAFDQACRDYELADIKRPVSESRKNAQAWHIYVSPAVYAGRTAEALFEGTVPEEWKEIGEVPIRSFCDTNKQLPTWLWRAAGRLQWLLGNPRQPEVRSRTVARAEETVKRLEERNQDCVLVTHGLFLRTLLREFRRKGYCITSSRLFGSKPLDRFRAAKWSDHCGGCQHNCLLSNPGCQIGRDKAKRRSKDRF